MLIESIKVETVQSEVWLHSDIKIQIVANGKYAMCKLEAPVESEILKRKLVEVIEKLEASQP